MWSMHPWERDARVVKKALKKGDECYSLIVEVACTRSSDDLLGARKAYHSLFDQSMEEDIASNIHGSRRKVSSNIFSYHTPSHTWSLSLLTHWHVSCVCLCMQLLVGLVSAYRYEGNKVNDDLAKSDAKILAEAVASPGEKAIENDEVVRILSTRSKLHIQQLYKHFNQINGSDLLGVTYIYVILFM